MIPGRAGVVISCEHAANALPPGTDLGIDAAALASHVAWDPGAAAVADELARRLRCRPHRGRWSRLWVDLNRSPEGAIHTRAWGVDIPGNRVPADRAERLAHRDAHEAAVRRDAEAALRHPGRCVHLGIHSFCPDPALPGRRDHEVGVLFDPAAAWESEVAAALLDALGAAGFSAAPNEPYLGTEDGLTTRLRGTLGGRYAGLEIELSQAMPADRAQTIVDPLLRGLAAVLGTGADG